MMSIAYVESYYREEDENHGNNQEEIPTFNNPGISRSVLLRHLIFLSPLGIR